MRRDTYLTFYVKMEITKTTAATTMTTTSMSATTLKEAVGHEISTVINLLNVVVLLLLLFQSTISTEIFHV